MSGIRSKPSAQSLKVRRDKESEALRRRWFAELCVQRGLPEPVFEYRFALPDRQWRFDYAFLEHRIAIEVQGGLFVRGAHSRGAQQLKDYEKLNAAVVRGWRVFQVTPQQLCTAETIAMLTLAFGVAA